MSSSRRSQDSGHDGSDEAQGVAPVDTALVQILSRARELPREVQPERDLWPQLARRLADDELESSPRRAPRADRRRGRWQNWLSMPEFGPGPGPGWAAVASGASGALLLVLSSVAATLWWTGEFATERTPQRNAEATRLSTPALGTTTSDEEARRVADTLRGRDGVGEVHASLLDILERRRGELPPQTVAALEENLRIIDHAIVEIHLAMKNSADSHLLGLLLAETYRREAELLKQLEWWSPPLEERSS